jgi:hypothetical protein
MSETSEIEGITSYEVDSIASTIYITYDGGDITTETHYAASESDLKEIVRHVNHRLGNCRKPGVKKRNLSQKTNRNLYELYEQKKREIAETAKTPAEYERRIKALTKRLRV